MAAILAGCSSQPKGLPAGSDAGRTLAAAPAWRLSAAHLPQGQPIPALFAEGLAYQMRFADGQAVMEGGCNRMSGGYAVDKAYLKIEQFAATRMACEPARMQADEWISRQFGMPLKMRFETSSRLELETMDGSKLRFEADTR